MELKLIKMLLDKTWGVLHTEIWFVSTLIYLLVLRKALTDYKDGKQSDFVSAPNI